MSDSPAAFEPRTTVTSVVTRCPRCNGVLLRDIDPDSLLCLMHGSIYMGEPIAFIEPRSMSRSETARRFRSQGKDLIAKHCACGAEIADRSKACVPCTRVAMAAAKAARS